MSEERIKRTEISSLGEFGLIHRLTESYRPQSVHTVQGIGDDAAVLSAGADHLLVSTDMMVEGIHFDLMYAPLPHLGYKAVITNLSDIAAMNALPEQITVSIALSNRFSLEAVQELYEGIYRACDEYGVDLIGGDTCSSKSGLVISITVMGRARPELITYRSAAQEGDLICVTGDLGASYLGLQLLEREKQVYLSQPDLQPDLEEQEYAVRRQLLPRARTDMIHEFSNRGFKPTSMIDISDGLASEVYHICLSSQLGARIDEAMVPIRHEAELLALKFKLDPITCALNGGEDYELLFTADPMDLDLVKVLPDVSIIGEMRPAEEGMILRTSGGNHHMLRAQGWQHFGNVMKDS